MTETRHVVHRDQPAEVSLANDYRLYVSMASPISLRAIANARRILQEAYPGTHQLTVLNIAENVESARADQIIVSPTLLRLAPLPQRRFIGDLSDLNRLRKAFGLQPALGAA
ncbi:MAG: circadian clock KaiB family protein [Pseudomonadota bacterium]